MPLVQIDDNLIVTYGKVGTTSLFNVLNKLPTDRWCVGNDGDIMQGYHSRKPKSDYKHQQIGTIEPNPVWLDMVYPQLKINVCQMNDQDLNRKISASNWINHNRHKQFVLLMRNPHNRFFSGMLMLIRNRFLNPLLYRGVSKNPDKNISEYLLESTSGFPSGDDWSDLENTMSQTETEQIMQDLLDETWWQNKITVLMLSMFPNVSRNLDLTRTDRPWWQDPVNNVCRRDLEKAQEYYHMGNYLLYATQQMHKPVDLAVELRHLSEWCQSQGLTPEHRNVNLDADWGFAVNNPHVSLDKSVLEQISDVFESAFKNSQFWPVWREYLKPEMNTYTDIIEQQHSQVKQLYKPEQDTDASL